MEKTLKKLMVGFVVAAALILANCSDGSDGGNGTWRGTKLTGAWAAETYGKAVAVDDSGNVIVAGRIDSEEADVSNVTLDDQYIMGTESFYVTKYNSGGSKQWTRTLGTYKGSAYGEGVAVDADGNVYVAGYSIQYAPGGSGNLQYGLDGQLCLDSTEVDLNVSTMFLTKYSASGAKEWTRLQGAGTGNEDDIYGYGVATDSAGNVYVCGATTGVVNVPVGVTGPAAMVGGTDLFVSKFDSDGMLQYTKTTGSGGTTSATSIAVSDADDYVFITGSTTGDLWLTGTGSTQNGITDMIVGFTYNDATDTFDGLQLTTQTAGGYFTGTCVRTAYSDITATNNVFLTGESTEGFLMELDFDGDGSDDSTRNTAMTGLNAGFFIKLAFDVTMERFSLPSDTNNPYLHVGSDDAHSYMSYTGVTPATDGETAYVSGYANFTLSSANLYSTKSGVYDSILMQYPQNIDTQAMLGTVGEYSYGNAIAVNSNNQVFIAGDAHGNLDGVYKQGGVDAFVTKYLLNSEGGVTHY